MENRVGAKVPTEAEVDSAVQETKKIREILKDYCTDLSADERLRTV